MKKVADDKKMSKQEKDERYIASGNVTFLSVTISKTYYFGKVLKR